MSSCLFGMQKHRIKYNFQKLHIQDHLKDVYSSVVRTVRNETSSKPSEADSLWEVQDPITKKFSPAVPERGELQWYLETPNTPKAKRFLKEKSSDSTAATADSSPRDLEIELSVRRRPLRVVCWNIELGYKLRSLSDELQRMDADILLLQEVDIFAWIHQSRPNECSIKNSFATLCRDAQLHGVFAAGHTYRHDYDSETTLRGGWGTALLWNPKTVKPVMSSCTMVRLPFTPDFDRSAIRLLFQKVHASVEMPDEGMLCYSTHLNVCCGITQRQKEFITIMDDADAFMQTTAVEAVRAKTTDEISLNDFDAQVMHYKQNIALIVAGDMNTFGHGLMRISPMHCNDEYRFKNFGMQEAEVFNDQFLKPEWRMHDPFNKTEDTTLASLCGLVDAKLDWILMRNLAVVPAKLSNFEGPTPSSRGSRNLLDVSVAQQAFERFNTSTYKSPMNVDNDTKTDNQALLPAAYIGTGSESDHQWISVDVYHRPSTL